MLPSSTAKWVVMLERRGLRDAVCRILGHRPTDRQLVDFLWNQVRWPDQQQWDADRRVAGNESSWQPFDDATQAILDLKRDMTL